MDRDVSHFICISVAAKQSSRRKSPVTGGIAGKVAITHSCDTWWAGWRVVRRIRDKEPVAS
jgi:hypothetical protein